MRNQTAISLVLAATGLALTCGCVHPGRVEPSIVTDYVHHLVRGGPGIRQDTKGLGLLAPAVTAAGPELRTETRTAPDGTTKTVLLLTLDEAIRLGLANSPEIRVVSYDPAVSREEMVQAAAEFDYVVFGSLFYTKVDERPNTTAGGGQSIAEGYSVGMRQKTITGAEWDLTWTMTRAWTNSAAVQFTSSYEPVLELAVTQPLLRNAWPAVNLATLRLARVNHRVSLAAFRQRVEEVVASIVSSYWVLSQARQDYAIQDRLLVDTLDTREKVAARAEEGLAATLQVDQIDAVVEQRRAGLVAARKTVIDAQDALTRLLADERINVLTDAEVVPTTPMSDVKVLRNVPDQLLTSLQHSPLLEQARLGIDAEAINVQVAANQVLPKLDLTASTQIQGLGGNRTGARSQFHSGDYIGYSVALSAEYPLGNRQRRAELRRARLNRFKAVAGLQNVADQIAQAIREQIRRVNAAHDQILALDEAIQAAKDYRDKVEVTVSPKFGQQMSPERLQLLLQAQELVANLESSRLQAVTTYNTALTELEQTKGTVLEMYRLHLPTVARGESAPAAPLAAPADGRVEPASP